MREYYDGRKVFAGRGYRVYQVSRLFLHGCKQEEESAYDRYLLLVIYVVCPLSGSTNRADGRN